METKHTLAVLTAEQMKASDAYTIETLGIPSKTLMENAAHGIAEIISKEERFGKTAVILCGGGNNGGDGFATARFLEEDYGFSCTVCYFGRLEGEEIDLSHMTEECKRQYIFCMGKRIAVCYPDSLYTVLKNATVVVDAVFGVGLAREVTGKIAAAFETVKKSGLPVVAVDIPSGLSADTGKVLGTVLPAARTVAIQNVKPGHILYPGAELCGKLHLLDIGVKLKPDITPCMTVTGETLLDKTVKIRNRHSHKGTYGKLCLACGSKGMSGAAYMACKAALRSGIGIAYILTTEDNRMILQSMLPEAIVRTYDPENIKNETILETVKMADGFAIGPGLSRGENAHILLKTLLNLIPVNGETPVVLDADALYLLGKNPDLWETAVLENRKNPIVLTPHPAEMSMLTGIATKDVLENSVGIATAYAKEKGVTVVLKDAHTVIAGADETRYINLTGNAGMATGGSGDVLTGIVGSLLTQNRKEKGSAAMTAAAAVYIHGTAGNLAADKIGEIGMLPTDIAEEIPTVLRRFSDTKTVLTLSAYPEKP